MSVNNIDFTLGSYNPNQAAGLIAMARENDKQISDSLKGILDGFEKTARENADVQAMNYINSLGLQDMTPDKMALHTQELEKIADNMGGLNPSKEALTALDGRGNVLTQRAMNDVSLATSQHNWHITKDEHDYKTALPVLAGDFTNMQEINRDISILDSAIANYKGDTSSEEYKALNNQRDQLISNYAKVFENYSNVAGTLSPYYTNNLQHNIELFNKNILTESQTATNNLNTANDIASGRAAEMFAPVIHQAISSRFQTSVGADGTTTTIDTTTGKPVTGDEVNKVISSMFDSFGLTGDTATMTMNKISSLQAQAQKEAFTNDLALKNLKVRQDAITAQVDMNNTNNQTKREIAAAQLEADVAARQTKADADAAKAATTVTATNPNLRYNSRAQKLEISHWAEEDGAINASQIKSDVARFIKDTNDRVATGYYDANKGKFVKGGIANWYKSSEGSKILNELQSSGYVADGKAVQTFETYFNNAPNEILNLIPTDAHKVEFIKNIAAAQHKDQTHGLDRALLTITRGFDGTKPLNLILGLDADGKFSKTFRAKGNDTIVKNAALAASNSIKGLKQESMRNYLNPRFEVLISVAALNKGLHTIEDVVNTYGLGSIMEIKDLYNIPDSDTTFNPFKK